MFVCHILWLVVLVVPPIRPFHHHGSHGPHGNDDDEIISLPGLDFDVDFRSYSGYLQASETRFLHYWLVESQNSSRDDPLIFWFNGGPACSSVDSLIVDSGPYLVNDDGETLRPNPYAWNQFANVVYLDAPAGVGFSYATDGNYAANDNTTAAENYAALKDFFTKFPHFRNYRIFLTGQSYAGIYVPTLAATIVEGQSEYEINLEGIVVGNAYVNHSAKYNTLFHFLYNHGFIGEEFRDQIRDQCCDGVLDDCHIIEASDDCAQTVYDYYNAVFVYLNPYEPYANCVQPWDATLVSGNQPSVDGTPCFNGTSVTDYMNSDDVREALHIRNESLPWAVCSTVVGYTRTIEDVTSQVQQILDAGVRVLFYYGDVDMVCNLLIGETFTASLGLEVDQEKQPWYLGSHLGGMKTTFDGNLTYITIRGAGHLASQLRPPQVQYAVRQFVEGNEI